MYVQDLDYVLWRVDTYEQEQDVRNLHTNEVKEYFDDWEDRMGSRSGSRKGSSDHILHGKSPNDFNTDEIRSMVESEGEEHTYHYLLSKGLSEWDASEYLSRITRKGQDFTSDGIKTVANAFKDITTKKIPDTIGKMNEKRNGSHKGNTVQQIVDAFDDIDNTSNEQLIQLAKDLPDGLGEDVIIALGVGAWRGDEPEEIEFFRIIDSKFPRNGSHKGSGPLCELGSVSGKGSRPENIGSIASKVALNRKRSINMDGEYIENN